MSVFRASMTSDRRLRVVGLFAWLAIVMVGMLVLIDYSSAPGSMPDTSETWPTGSAIGPILNDLAELNSEGLFAGRHDVLEPSDEAVSDRLLITRATSEELFKIAFEQARARRRTPRCGRRGWCGPPAR